MKAKRTVGANREDKEKIRSAAAKLDAIVRFLNQNYTAKSIAYRLTKMSANKLSKLRHLDTSSYGATIRESTSLEIIEVFKLSVTEINGQTDNTIFEIRYLKESPFLNEKIYYDYYFLDRDNRIERTLLSISKDKKSAEMLFFHPKSGVFIPRIKLTDGEITESKERMSFSIFFRKFIIIHNNQEVPRQYLCTFRGDIFDINAPIKIGTYSDSFRTNCGIAIIIHTIDYNLDEKSGEKPKDINSFLLGSVLDTKNISESELIHLFKEEADSSFKCNRFRVFLSDMLG